MIMRKNQIQTYAIFLSVLLIGIGCSNNEQEEPDFGKDVAQKVEFVLYGLPQTRATDTQFETGDAIGVFASTRSDRSLSDKSNYADNAKYVYSSGRFIHTGAGIAAPYESAQSATYYAVYPFIEQTTPQFSFKVRSDQSTYDALTQSDLMLAIATASATATTVPLRFDHMMSRIVVDCGDIYLDPQKDYIEIYDFSQGVKVNIATHQIETVSSSSMTNIQMYNAGNGQLQAIMSPQLLSTARVVGSLHLGTLRRSILINTDIEMRSGFSYHLKLKKGDEDYYFQY